MDDGRIYIGSLSGTSMDQIDSVAGTFCNQRIEVLAHQAQAIPTSIRNKILQLQQQPIAATQIGCLDTELGELFATSCQELIKRLDHQQVAAVGLHGQTIAHNSTIKPTFSIQIGNPNIVAVKTACCVISDFRRMDMALGGQGAPLAGAFHEAFFRQAQETRAIVNIGGIANISILKPQQDTLSFDCGPGNILMDRWTQRHLKKNYDKNGAWAASAHCDDALLTAIRRDALLNKSEYPSLCASEFSEQWLDKIFTAPYC